MADKLDKTNVNNMKDAADDYKTAEKAVRGIEKGVDFLGSAYQASLPQSYFEGYKYSVEKITEIAVTNRSISYFSATQIEVTPSFKTVEAHGTVASIGKMMDADNLVATKSWASGLPEAAKNFGAIGRALDYGAKTLDIGITAEAGIAHGKSFGHAMTGAVADVAIGAVFDLAKFGVAMEVGAKFGAMAGATGGGLVTAGNPVGIGVGGVIGGIGGAGFGGWTAKETLAATGMDITIDSLEAQTKSAVDRAINSGFGFTPTSAPGHGFDAGKFAKDAVSSPDGSGFGSKFSKDYDIAMSAAGHGFHADKFAKDAAFVDVGTAGMSFKEATQYGPGTPGNFPGAATGMSFKEATQYGPGTGSISSAAAAAAVSVSAVGAPAPATPSLASTLDVHGIAAPSAGLTGTVSVGGIAHSNFGSVSFSSVGIGTPVGAGDDVLNANGVATSVVLDGGKTYVQQWKAAA